MRLLRKGIIIWITSCHFFANFDGGKTKKRPYVRKNQKPKKTNKKTKQRIKLSYF